MFIGIDPADGSTDVPVNQTIIITFNDNIQAGANFSKIAVTRSDGLVKAIPKP